jgi:hypothetical protein
MQPYNQQNVLPVVTEPTLFQNAAIQQDSN